ncbi:hypothetical protein ACH5RR_005279 [Cinchona calisaya]|uniref:PRONE domain-containing protein n=1 Tax=Cinchona calisaya TaxID=153742 RepID=A0ABD3AKS6_9GENT
MDTTLPSQEEKEVNVQLKHYVFLKQPSRKSSRKSNPLSLLKYWASKSLKNFYGRRKMSSGIGSEWFHFNGMVVNNSIYCASPCSSSEDKMESLLEKMEEMGDKNGGFCDNVRVGVESSGESSLSSGFLASEITVNDAEQSITVDSSSPPSMVSPIQKDEPPHYTSSHISQDAEKPHSDTRKLEKLGSSLPETEMMKERFAKLLLGEDMSGCGNGVSTALAISNAITNLCATIFGQIWRLEPLPLDKKLMWRRDMEWILSVSDHIVELIPSLQTFPDGSTLEVMTSRPRSDLYVNLPGLHKLDNMLLEILDSFVNTEFWYVDQGIIALEENGSSSFWKPLPRQEEKWWLPVPRVPTGGLSENSRKLLQHRRDCTNQILKATMAINSITIAEMEVPESYLEALPKNAKATLGDLIHQYMNSDQFSAERLLDCLDLSSEHQTLEIANRVEASIYVWRRRNGSKVLNNTKRSNSKSSWEIVKDLVIDADKGEQLSERAESLLLCLKQRFPGLSQTTLDTSKIQYNKDVGKAILESYSRVLESLAFNIVARIDDLFYVDDLTKHSDQPLSISKVVLQMLKGHPVLENKPPNRGFGVKKVLTDYLSIDTNGKDSINQITRSDSSSSTYQESSASQSVESY